jgi:hypothetical protein
VYTADVRGHTYLSSLFSVNLFRLPKIGVTPPHYLSSLFSVNLFRLPKIGVIP